MTEAVLTDPEVATLSFTGSTYVGKLLLSQTAQRWVGVHRCSLPLRTGVLRRGVHGPGAPIVTVTPTEEAVSIAWRSPASVARAGSQADTSPSRASTRRSTSADPSRTVVRFWVTGPESKYR